MSEFVFAPMVQPGIAVVGRNACFPVRRIFCVGQNYAAHAREMGRDPEREPPFFFTKPADAIMGQAAKIPYPPLTRNLHYEAELVVAIGRAGRNIPASQALEHIWGYAAGNDLTRRDLQAKAKDKGQPWDWGKAFDHSAVCGPLTAVEDCGTLRHGRIQMRVNDVVMQDADISEMIWNIPEIIAILSESVAIEAGDLIYTGTPAGVGPLTAGDKCRVEIEMLPALEFEIV